MPPGARRRQRAAQLLTPLSAGLDRLPPLATAALVTLPLLAIYLASATYAGPVSADPRAAAMPAWRLAFAGDLNLDAFEGAVRWLVEADGRLVSDRQPGSFLPAVPFYWLFGDVSRYSLAPASIAAATFAAAGVGALHLVFRRLARPSTAVVAAFVVGLATATWSVSADALWPHSVNQLWLALALLAASSARFAATGLLLGAAVLARSPLAVVPAVTGLWEAARQRRLRPAVVVAATSGLGVAGLLAYNAHVFGGLSLSGGYPDTFVENLATTGSRFWALNVLGTLVSPDRGILVLSPFLLALVPGLVRAWRVAPPWVRSAAVGGLVYLLLVLRMNRFSGGNNFYSYRYPIESLTLAAPLLLLSWREWVALTRLRRVVFAVLAILAGLVHALGALFWSPPLVERSPWTNCNLCEAAAFAGPAATALLVGVAGLAVLAVTVLMPRGVPAASSQEGRRR